MINFSKVDVSEQHNRDFILKRISDSMIFAYYFGPFQFGQVYKSKLRTDVHPSTGFYVSPIGKLIYNDLATGEKYDCFRFVQTMYNLTFSETLKRICFDFGLIDGKISPKASKTILELKDFDKEFKKETKINFVAEKWNSDNFAYWKAYNITKDELKREHIYPIKKLYVNESLIYDEGDGPRYALTMVHKGEQLTKVYAPLSENLRWLTNIPTAQPFGTKDLKNDTKAPFIAKSQKCRIVLKKFLPSVIAIQSEQEAAISDTLFEFLIANYDLCYLGADNDETGLRFMEKMKEKSKGFIVPLYLPKEEEGIKDYSDCSKVSGLKAVEQFLKQKKLI
jgi:hypothetical protein